MVASSTKRLSGMAERVYSWLLLTYPADFRRAYAAEMFQTFRHACRETFEVEGHAGLARLCGWTLYDFLATAVQEHSRALLLHLKHLISHPTLFVSPTGLEMLLTAPLQLQIAQHTDIGVIRTLNEDNLLTFLPEDPQILHDKGALFVVADGMGGHDHGERASKLAVTSVREAYYQAEQMDIAGSLTYALKHANALIYAENVSRPDALDAKSGMGTTCVTAVLQGKTLTAANVGDSRVYVVHEGAIRQISRDHSLVARMVLNGEITAEEARTHEKRNVIYRALGIQPEVEVDVFTEELSDADTVVLCTDGLSGLITDAEILQIIETHEPQESVKELIARANAAGGTDNITAIVVKVE